MKHTVIQNGFVCCSFKIPFTGTRWLNMFQNDNVPVQKARSGKTWFAGGDVQELEWSEQCPVLNSNRTHLR